MKCKLFALLLCVTSSYAQNDPFNTHLGPPPNPPASDHESRSQPKQNVYTVVGVVIGTHRRVAAISDTKGQLHIITAGDRLPDQSVVKKIDLKKVIISYGKHTLRLEAPQ